MARNPTYEEMERRIKELEKETARHQRAEQALREREQKYRELVEEIPDGVFVTDEAGIVLFCNQALAHIFSYDSVDEFSGVNFFDLIVPEEKNRIFEKYTPGH